MTREDIESLLMQIKSFYPRFESVDKRGSEFSLNPAVVNAWHKTIGWMTIENAMRLLDMWMQSEEGSRPPQISFWIRNGKEPEKDVRSTMTLDRKHGCVVWEPEAGGNRYEISVRYNPRSDDFIDAEGRIYVLSK